MEMASPKESGDIAATGTVVHPLFLRMLNRERMKGVNARDYHDLLERIVVSVGAYSVIDQLRAIDVVDATFDIIYYRRMRGHVMEAPPCSAMISTLPGERKLTDDHTGRYWLL